MNSKKSEIVFPLGFGSLSVINTTLITLLRNSETRLELKNQIKEEIIRELKDQLKKEIREELKREICGCDKSDNSSSLSGIVIEIDNDGEHA